MRTDRDHQLVVQYGLIASLVFAFGVCGCAHERLQHAPSPIYRYQNPTAVADPINPQSQVPPNPPVSIDSVLPAPSKRAGSSEVDELIRHSTAPRRLASLETNVEESSELDPNETVPTQPGAELLSLIEEAQSELGGVQNYQVLMKRQERVRGKLLDEELILLSVRREPFAVRLEWPDGVNQGREVIYDTADPLGVMHISLGRTLIPMPPMRIKPDSPMARKMSKHPITEAGLSAMLETLQGQVEALHQSDPTIGDFTIGAPESRPESNDWVIPVVRQAPDGESWVMLLDADTKIPEHLEGTDADGNLIERIQFEELTFDLEALNDPGAFDPSVRFSSRGSSRR